MTCLARMNGDVSAPSSTLENGGSEVQKWGVKVQWRQWWWFCLVYLRDTNDVIMRGFFQLQSTPGSKTHFFLHFIFLSSQKILEFENCRIWIFKILAFSTNFCPIKIDLSGTTVWPQASGLQKLAKMDHFWHF